MGGCLSKTESRNIEPSSSDPPPPVQLTTVSSPLIKVLAEVHTLGSRGEGLSWCPLFHGLVPVSLTLLKEGAVYSYRISASGVDEKSLDTLIYIPGTQLRQTAPTFVQWRESEERAWGLSFLSPDDSAAFLTNCSPPTLTPTSKRLRHSFSTLSLPTPPVPTSVDNGVQEPTHLVLDIDTESSPSSSAVSSPGAQLFQPSSPLALDPESFLLPDIKEELSPTHSEKLFSDINEKLLPDIKEELLPNHSQNVLPDINEEPSPDDSEPKPVLREHNYKRGDVLHRRSFDFTRQSFEEAGLCVDETRFDDIIEEQDPPLPDPLTNLIPTQFTSSEAEHLNRLSMASEAPPLPDSLPPGKPISPRHSLLASEVGLDLSSILSCVSTLNELLPSPVASPLTKHRLQLTPSFLQNIRPPSQFLDVPPDSSADPTPPGPDHSSNEDEDEPPQLPQTGPPEDEDSELDSGPHGGSSIQGSSIVNGGSSRISVDDDSSSVVSTQAGDSLVTMESRPHTPGTRKTGWVEVKPLLVSKNRKVGNAPKNKRKWKRYWASLKGTTLSLGQRDEEGEAPPVDIRLGVELSLASPVHDHLKREHLLSLTTATGHVYYLQTAGDTSDWVTAIHNAATLALTGQGDHSQALHILKERAEQLDKSIEKEKKLRNLTALNLSTTSQAVRTMTTEQLALCVDNIEKYSVELYRVRCYIASLEGHELPNPQSLLSAVSRGSKQQLARLGVFTVAAFTALVNARHSCGLSTVKGKLEGLKGQTSSKSLRELGISNPLPAVRPRAGSSPNYDSTDQAIDTSETEDGWEVTVAGVGLPSGGMTQAIIRSNMTVGELLREVSQVQRLDPSDHYIRLKLSTPGGVFGLLPHTESLLTDLSYTSVDLCQKCVYSVSLTRSVASDWGMSLNPVLSEEQLVSVSVANIETESVASSEGINAGDELLLVNEVSVAELGWARISELLATADEISLTLRTCLRDFPLASAGIVGSLVCPAPPAARELTLESVEELTVPRPLPEGTEEVDVDTPQSSDVLQLLSGSQEVSRLVRVWRMREEPREWSREDRLLKTVTDLLDTEAEFIRGLEVLVDRYLSQFESEHILSTHEVETLCGDCPRLLEAQRQFHSCLQEIVTSASRDSLGTMVEDIAGAFTANQAHFRAYCTFCAGHQKAKQLASRTEDYKLQRFLEARNPGKQSSLALSTLLSKPIVRISRYPLFMSAIADNTDKGSPEREAMKGAVSLMATVAAAINEAQRVCEEYQSVFESLLSSSVVSQVPMSISIAELKYHGEAQWLNPSTEGLARGWRKGQGPPVNCFIFNTVVILVCADRRRKESKGLRELSLSHEDLRFSVLLPCVYCRLNDLPNSDGVSNMWQLLYRPRRGPASNFLFRNEEDEEKAGLLRWLDYVLTDQRRLYTVTPPGSGRSTPTLRSPTHFTRSLSPLSQ